jgi:hypothetical protein
MRRWLAVATAASLAFINPLPPVGAQSQLDIAGSNAKCMIAGEFPQLDAIVQPADQVAKVRVYFKSALANDWYYVDAAPQAGNFVGVLPKPNVNAGPITYYFEAVSKDLTPMRSAEVSAKVVESAGACGDDKPAAIAAAGPAAVFGPAGATVGFAGTAVAGTAITAGVAGGAVLGTTALVGAGIVAAGVTTGLVTRGGSDPTPTPTTAPGGLPTAEPTPSPTAEPTLPPVSGTR